jgi:DNA-binding transcriptional MerR regulator
MNVFTIRDIENLCGIKAHTLRAWEQRYKLICPKRKAGNHRTYSNEDLKYLLRIAYLYHNGYRISGIAGLSESEICELALSLSPQSDAIGIYMNQLTEASFDFNQEQFDRILHNIILHFGLEKSITMVIFPFLKKIGLLWMTGHVIPAQEHFASTFITKKLSVAINGLDPVTDTGGRMVLLFAPRGEMHEIPLLFMQYLLRKNKVPTIYFGKNIELEEIEYYCRHRRATHLYLNLITNLTRCDPAKYLSRLASLFPAKQIVASGQQVDIIHHHPPNVRILRTAGDFISFAGEG